MNVIYKHATRILAAAVIGVTALASSSAPVWAATSAADEVKQDWAKQRHEWLKHYTDKLADRLEIKASQQNAWQAYTKALEGGEHPAKPLDDKSDAASITRMHANMAAMQAQHLAQIADATAKLQEVLSPEQRKTLDQIAAHSGHHHGHHFGDHEHGEHDGHGEHGGHWGHQQGGDEHHGQP